MTIQITVTKVANGFLVETNDETFIAKQISSYGYEPLTVVEIVKSLLEKTEEEREPLKVAA